MATKQFRCNDTDFKIQLEKIDPETVMVQINDHQLKAGIMDINENTISIFHQDQRFTTYIAGDDEKIYVSVNGEQFVFENMLQNEAQYQPGVTAGDDAGNDVCAPMPGKIIKVFVSPGQMVEKGERLFIVEAMKMENEVKAVRAGEISKVNFGEADLVSVGQAVVEFVAIVQKEN